MRIQIKNLGNVEFGDLDISKRLTVFCGPNNTGKTYVSYVIYSLLKPQYYYDNTNVPNLSGVFVEDNVTVELQTKNLLSFRKSKLQNVRSNLESLFGISDSDKLSLFKDLNLQYCLSDDDFLKKVSNLELKFPVQWNGLTFLVQKEKGKLSVRISKPEGVSVISEDSYFFSWQIMTSIYEMLVNYPFSKSCIFPVERNSIYTFNKELSIQRNELIEQMQALKDNKRIGFDSVDRLLGRSTRYPLAIRDCLSVANDLNNYKKQKSEYMSFAEILERKLLGGKISVTKEGEVEFVPKKGQRLPIHLSASIVKTLSSLTFYLKHLAVRGDLIIIDEPEMNLHPDAQVMLARIFGQMVNNGLNILISTHSDYVIRELNNMISLGSISDRQDLMTELNYSEDEVLSASDVSVYLFKPKRANSKMVKLERVEVKDDGFSMETIDEVIYTLNVNSDRINYKLRYDE